MSPAPTARLLDRRWLRPRPTRAQLRIDGAIAVTAAVVAVVNVELYRSASGSDLGWHGIEAYLWFAVAGLLLAGRRAAPLLVLVAESAIFIVVGERMTMLGTTFPIQMILFAALYAAWAWSRHVRALVVLTVVVLGSMFGWLLWSLLQPGALPQADQGGLLDPGVSALVYSLLINVVYFFGAIAWGQMAWRGARERRASEQETALELALADQRRERAVADERVRIARDLHDVVAHHVSSIGIQAEGAARVLAVDPSVAREALTTIGSSSRQAVSQMHELVHLLRGPGEQPDRAAGRAPQPGLADIPALATLAGDGDTPVVEHQQVGSPFAVPDTTAHSLFRITQEAVTNVRRHAGARRASVVLRYLDEPRAVEVEVVDDGTGGPTRGGDGDRGDGGDGGYGLTGIRERAALHGGVTEIGPRPQGGWRVRVRIPVTAVSP